MHAQRTVCTKQLSRSTSSLVSCEVLVARVVPLVVDAVIGLTLGLIAHVVIVVFVVAILHRIFLYGIIGPITVYQVSPDRSVLGPSSR